MPSGTEKVKRAMKGFVSDVKTNEPDTRIYAAWQQKDDPTRFVHSFIFVDATAHNVYSKSAAVKRFESIYRPELVGGDVVFTDYDPVATNHELTPIRTWADRITMYFRKAMRD